MDSEDAFPFAEEPVEEPVVAEVVAEAVVVEPEEPRLSIMHMLVWTACVAVYFSFMRTMAESGQRPFLGGSVVVSVFYGLGMGTALAGLVLLGSRRLRGFPLAKHPGEYLLLLFGVSLVSSVVLHAIVAQIGPRNLGNESWVQYVLMITSLGTLVVNGGILLVAAVRVKIRRWRVFFLIVMLTAVFQRVLPVVLSMAGLFSVRFFAIGFPQLVGHAGTVALLVVVVMDLCGRKRYPWQHWLGVGLQFWFGAFAVGWVLYYYVFGDLPS